jgi:RHS repeat-associated protein
VGLVEYAIDAAGRRTGKKVGGALLKGWLYDGAAIVAELDGAGNVVSRFFPGGMIKGGATYRILRDHLGSPRLVVDTATGAVAQRMDFDEFGRVLQDTNPGFTPFGFAGGHYDPDTGLVRFGARDYMADVGRWTAKDPIRFQGGDTNLYGYVFNDPVNLVDPFGLAGYPTSFPALDASYDTVAANWWRMKLYPDAAIAYYKDRFQMKGNFVYNSDLWEYGMTPAFSGFSYIGNTSLESWHAMPVNMWHEEFHQVEESLLQKAFCSEADSETDAWEYALDKMWDFGFPFEAFKAWRGSREYWNERQRPWERW